MKKSKKSKNTVKNRWDCVQIFMCACECFRVCVCVGYSCLLLWVNVYVVFSIYIYIYIYIARERKREIKQLQNRMAQRTKLYIKTCKIQQHKKYEYKCTNNMNS